jgi:predicted kinase
MTPTITLLVGPPGSGKSTEANKIRSATDSVYVNQDSQGHRHLEIFNRALLEGRDIIVDRMNFNKTQRNRYLEPAEVYGYLTKIIVLHVPFETCLQRASVRANHETIADAETAEKAIRGFFSNYERVSDGEADEVVRLGWKPAESTKAIWSDLDGTLANVNHRLHYVRNVDKKKMRWDKFFADMDKDTVNEWCKAILDNMSDTYPIVYATGRPEDYMNLTIPWLQDNGLRYPGSKLFSRLKGDYRKDDIVKEIILEFEVKTRYNVLFAIDDRQQVVDMLRRHNITVLQCAKGDF